MDEMVKDVNAQILRNNVEVRRWAAYFKRAGTECGKCQGGKYQCSCQLTDTVVARFE